MIWICGVLCERRGFLPYISCSSMGSSSKSSSVSESDERKSAGLGTAAKIPES